MPYIIMKRSDIPAGTLQVLDMEPNVSQRNLTLDPPGQTKYVNPVLNDTVVTTGAGPVLAYTAARGLAAWFLTNVNDGTGAAAQGTITVTAANVDPGDSITIDGLYTFTAVAGPRTPGSDDFSLDSGTDAGIAADLAAAINDPANQSGALVGVLTAGAALAVVTLDADQDGTAGNLPLTTNDGTAFAVVGMAGGADAGALTAADANDNAQDVLGLLEFGSFTAGANELTLANINGALTAGSITAAQLSDVLDILAGRIYQLPRGVQIEDGGGVFAVSPAVGADGGPGFVEESNRALFLNDGLPLSVAMGELSQFTSSDFVYAGVTGDFGEAVVVYNDDGTFYTP